ncbi:MAG: type II secretion system protein GspC [Gammaproteobacteria bacterium]|nr:type II secretion system protein GspC [Gammaproteobacteria bacterium]MCW8910788.1 type II secretion system protein GspC [Gammaproteobacteria bacterium]MCW9004172.1 type II secretion system protein GspC [Gammaproteobacteria bacterium]MCW9055519.1 type II secretion system protein GspC [Gammaproteobacteria bacterium]
MKILAEKLPESFDLKSINKYLPTAVNLLLLLACSYTLAQLTWLLIPTDNNTTVIPVQQSVKTVSTQQSALEQKIQAIPDAHLFGEYQQKAITPVKKDAPETKLNLVLKGVLAAHPMKNASAIIAKGKNGKEDIYGIGDRVSSALVKEIHADRVILERNGRYETLRLPKEFSDNTLIKSAARQNTVSHNNTPGSVLGDIRSKILKNPTSFGEYAIPVPYNENGKLKGYRLQPQGNTALFDQVGLNPNDVVIAINGVNLNDPAKGLKALRELQKAKQVDITVLRNGSEIPLHFEIP